MGKFIYEDLKKISDGKAPKELVNALSFKDGLLLAKEMLNNDEWDDELQGYSTSLLEELRKKYSEIWKSSWKYDAFLGYAYDITLNYDKRYLFYKRAFDKVSPSPPQLLVALAGCCWAPGVPPITEEKAISLVKQALSKTIYYEGAGLLRGLYKSTGNTKEQVHWEAVLKNMEGKEVHLPSLDEVFDNR